MNVIPRGRPLTPQGCGCNETHAGCDPGSSRNRYFPGKLMTAVALQLEAQYGIGRRRLLNRTLWGWGIVEGLAVSVAPPDAAPGAAPPASGAVLHVAAGLAFDKHGRELVLAEARLVTGEHLRRCRGGSDVLAQGSEWVLTAHYAERPVGVVRIPDICGHCGPIEYDRLCETVVFQLWPRDAWPGPEPTEDDPRCPPEPRDSPVAAWRWRGGAWLCRWAEETVPAGEPGLLHEWDGLWLDPCDGVPLATLRVEQADPRCPVFRVLPDNACVLRPVVKRADLLFDLLRGRDLTRVLDVTWKAWHRGQTDFAAFREFFPGEPDLPEGDAHLPPLETKFGFTFDRPVQVATVTPDAVVVTVVIQDGTTEANTGGTLWGQVLRVPLTEVRPTDADGKLARSFVIHVDGEWAWLQIQSRTNWQSSRFFDGDATVEIAIRGDLILDCHDQTVDADPIGLAVPDGSRPAHSGNGSPGGTFVSPFRVAARQRTERGPGRAVPAHNMRAE